MANINLLPWREERRAELKKEFVTILVGVAVVTASLVFFADTYVNGLIESQQERNQYMQKHISELNKQVEEIRLLEAKKRQLLERMRVIQDLQGNRPIIVRIFDEMVRTLPDGVYYQSLNRKGKNISLTGIAESNNRISSLMRKVDNSGWFASPNLSSVSAKPKYGEQASGFSLSFSLSTPATGEENKAGK